MLFTSLLQSQIPCKIFKSIIFIIFICLLNPSFQTNTTKQQLEKRVHANTLLYVCFQITANK